jgi:N-acetylmuramoyl-L-alanine amidase
MKHKKSLLNILIGLTLLMFMFSFALQPTAASNLSAPTATPSIPMGGETSGSADKDFEYAESVLDLGTSRQLIVPLREAVQNGLASFNMKTKLRGQNLSSTLQSMEFDGRVLTIDLGNLPKLQERQWIDLLHAVDMEVMKVLYNSTGLQGINIEYNFLVNGVALADMLPRNRLGDEASISEADQSADMQGKKVVINPGHGYFTKSTGGWFLQRGYYYGIVEDFINLDLAVDLNRFVAASGGDARPTRQLNKSAGNHSSGKAWWQMGASEYIRSLGAPSTVWKPLAYNSTYDHDIAARPEYANWIGANAMVSIHNNGGGSSACNGHGTETWYDTSNAYAAQSQSLATAIHTKIIQRIREQWDPNWCDRGVKGANGSYGENRRFRGPAVIVELAFMDVQSDNSALQNATFRAIAMAAINEGLVQYNGGVACPSITGWRGEYWNNRSLSGYPVMCRNDANVNFDWGTAGPGGSVLSDKFSTRWTRSINLGGGNYRFHVKSDDGVRLWIDNTLVIDKWVDQGPTEYTVDKSLSAGSHSFKMEYYENGGGATARFWYESLGVTCSNQYKAEYFNNKTLSGSPTYVRCENWPINWDWGTGGPGNGIGVDNFSARWTATASFTAGSYTFIARSDDGVRVWLDGNLIIDKWIDQGPTEYRATQSVSAGNHSIKMEYYESGGGAVAQFRWEAAAPSNFALNRPAYSTSNESASTTPNLGNDGNTNSRWSSASRGVNEWWWVDMGSAVTFDRVQIRWETAYSPYAFIGWSSDGVNFTGYYYNTSTAGYYSYDLSGAKTYRYAGIMLITRASCCGNFSFWEFEVVRTSADTLGFKIPGLRLAAPEGDLQTVKFPRLPETPTP